jgi:hypothetical protein
MTYQIYLPVVNSTYDTTNQSLKGLALTHPFLSDLKTTNSKWYYNWSLQGNNTDQFVPMAWGGKETPLQTTGYLLFLNEPESKVQANKTPEQAVELLKTLKAKRPNLKIIVGGCGAIAGFEWMDKFKAINTVPIAGYHIHGYIETGVNLEHIVGYWTYIKTNFPGEIWVTEFADVFGKQIPEMLKAIKDLKIDRYAYFTNRVKGDEGSTAYPSSWPKPQQISLVTWDGTITDRGITYRDFV